MWKHFQFGHTTFWRVSAKFTNQYCDEITMKLHFGLVFDQFLVVLGHWGIHIAPRGTHRVVGCQEKHYFRRDLGQYIILDIKCFIQLQKLRKLWTKRKSIFFCKKKRLLTYDLSWTFKYESCKKSENTEFGVHIPIILDIPQFWVSGFKP